MCVMPARRKSKPSAWAKKLMDLREKWGDGSRSLSQTEAAKRIGVTLRSWSSWERGEREPLQPMKMLIDCLLKTN